MTILIPILWAVAAAGEPPPYAESLKCAAVTQAAAELAKEANDGMPEPTSFDLAMIWSFAVMDAARRDGVKADVAEAAQKTERAKVKPRVAAGDPETAAMLDACRAAAKS